MAFGWSPAGSYSLLMINGIGSVGGLIFNFPGLLFSGGKGFAAGFAKGSGVADFRELVRGMSRRR